MRLLLSVCTLTVSLTLSAVRLPAQQAQPLAGAILPKTLLTNQSVVLLARAGYSEDFLIDIIRHKRTRFDVSPEALAWLIAQGLGERVIRAMVVSNKKEEETAVAGWGSGDNLRPLAPIGAQRGTGGPAYLAVPYRFSTPPPESASWNTTGWNRNFWFALPNPPANGGR